jgi:signal transduction histidine kinase
MREVYWIIGTKARRLSVVLAALVAYIALLNLDLTYTSKQLPLLWLHFGFSALVALSFLAIGSLVWLYGSDRRVAQPLFCFSWAMMIAFTLETAALSGDLLLNVIADSGAALALAFCAWLLLLFPKNYLQFTLSSLAHAQQRTRTRQRALLPYGYLALVILLCGVAIVYFISNYVWGPTPFWLGSLYHTYDIVVLSGILCTIVISYRKLSSLREKQQLRIMVGGVIIAFIPLLLLTVLPSALGFPSTDVVDGQLSALTMGLLPFALGYSILRYQILVFDTYIRRAVAWAVGAVCLAVLAYFIIVLCSTVFASNISMYVVCIAVIAVIVAPCVWWLARTLTERLFFSEILHYRRLIEKPSLVIDETLDLAEASRLIELATLHAFETQQVCLFVLDESAGCYRLCPELGEAAGDVQRRGLLDTLHTMIDPEEFEGEDCLGMQSSVVERLAAAPRPLLPYEALRTGENPPVGLSRYFTTEPCRHKMLLAPVRAQGKMIGVLIIGERGDHQQYGGPDFEIVQIILSRFSPVLETARLYARANQQAALLNKLYRAGTILESAFQSIEEVASLYAEVAAGAAQAGAEIWLYDGEESALRRVAAAGPGPRIIQADSLQIAREQDWSSWFYEGPDADARNGPSAGAPSFLSQTPSFPFAWLPLSGSEQQIGALVLTYPRPHFFMKEEMRVLEMFAGQCAAALENARITLELRAAYERQQELDRLKDQFIVTASHELRTPLTAVQGYIELLNEYNTSLSVDVRADFIAKARRGCDELTLLVGNIMDASRIHIDTEQINLRPVVLAESVKHVVEILEAIIKRERRSVALAIPSDIQIMADTMRLRQVMLNLVSNAIKYSRPGTSVEIGARDDGEQVTIYVRDYGSGVEAADHQRLFERFVRLERDMNSPVRGAGLGLYICKQLVEAMGGCIWVESSGIAGEGSVFAFTLRAARERDQEAGDLDERASMSS